MKRILLALICVYLSSFAIASPNCPLGKHPYQPGFCVSFKTGAACHCKESGLPAGMCNDMKFVYDSMMARFHSIQSACQYQKDVPTQECIDDWSCFQHGGKDSQGRLCSGTGAKC